MYGTTHACSLSSLARADNWFFNADAGVRSAAELRTMYETSTGHNTALIIDFAPQPDGRLPPAQVAAAAALGSFVAACYGAPIVQGSGNTSIITLMPSAAVAVDRVLIAEDQRYGQLIRAFTVTATLGDGSTAVLAAGTSVGNKFIAVLAAPATIASVTLNVTAVAANATVPGGPFIKNFAVYSCSALASEADAAWEAARY